MVTVPNWQQWQIGDSCKTLGWRKILLRAAVPPALLGCAIRAFPNPGKCLSSRRSRRRVSPRRDLL
jgi:hypothetical protein